MKPNVKVSLLVVVIIIQFLYPATVNNTSTSPIVPIITNETADLKLQTTGSYKLEVYPEKSEFTTQENIVLDIFLYNPTTLTQITDSVVITTPLGSSVVQLTQFDNKVTLDKGEFVQGINTITVGYKDQIQTVQILVRNPVATGPTSTNLIVNDILNEKPAPGVPDYINYSLDNSMFINFPTETNEYVQVSLTYGLTNLVLEQYYYALNEFIRDNQINFTIPGFLTQIGMYNYTITLKNITLKNTITLKNIQNNT